MVRLIFNNASKCGTIHTERQFLTIYSYCDNISFPDNSVCQWIFQELHLLLLLELQQLVNCKPFFKNNLLMVSVIFHANMSNICWSQLLTREYSLLLFVIYDSRWRVFEFWTVGGTKEDDSKTSLWDLGNCDAWEIAAFTDFIDQRLIDNGNNCWLQPQL